jgi:polysaccharide pyruvyl transferase WcaK-like protein
MTEAGSKFQIPTLIQVLSLISALRVIADLGAKTRVMQLMTHENADVRYRALISVQRLLSQPWRAA